jgi:tetratricopeptide (TPR) repeat protein
MTTENSLHDRYQAILDDLLGQILGGKKIIGKPYIQRILAERIAPGTSEVFEGCIQEQLTTAEHQVTVETSEVKQSKLGHRIRALQTIGEVLSEWQQTQRASSELRQLTQGLIQSPLDGRLRILLEAIDRNRPQPLNGDQLRRIAKELQEIARTPTPNLEEPEQLGAIAQGLESGMATLVALEPYLRSWIYEPNQSVGFEEEEQTGPWSLWAQHCPSPLLKVLFEAMARRQSRPVITATADWVEAAIVLQGLQVGLVRWFENQTYSLAWGRQMSFTTLMTFAMLWCDLANESGGFAGSAGFQVALQVLRTATQRPDFPLYGGIFATFSGQTFQETLSYFDRPLKEVEGTQEKGRILTILGYSQGVLGRTAEAIKLHEEALQISEGTADQPCTIANLNHLSRIYLRDQDFDRSLSYSQKALVMSRQVGDRRGEANALANYGFAEVLAAQARAEVDEDIYERSIGYLERGLELSKSLEDSQSAALCYQSLASSSLALGRWESAIGYGLKGMEAAKAIGDFYLLGISSYYAAAAYYGLSDPAALFYALLATYQLHQLGAKEWQQAAELVHFLQQGRDLMGVIGGCRSQLLPWMGVDGYDSLSTIMAEWEGS